MLQLFKNTDFSVLFIAFFYFFIFYAANFLTIQPNLSIYSPDANFLATKIYAAVQNYSFLQHFILIISLLWQCFFINLLVIAFKLSKKASYITIPCAYLITFAFVNNDHLTPILLSNNFLVAGLWFLLSCYNKKAGLSEIFNSGFLLGAAALVSFTNFIYLPFFAIALIWLRNFDIKEFVTLLAGFFAPFLLFFTYYYLNDNASGFVADCTRYFNVASLTIEFNIHTYLSLFVILGIVLFSIFNLDTLQQKTTIKEQKYIQIIFLMLFWSALSFFVQPQFNTNSLTIFFIPLSILLSLNLQSFRSANISEIVYLLLLIIVIAVQYSALIF